MMTPSWIILLGVALVLLMVGAVVPAIASNGGDDWYAVHHQIDSGVKPSAWELSIPSFVGVSAASVRVSAGLAALEMHGSSGVGLVAGSGLAGLVLGIKVNRCPAVFVLGGPVYVQDSNAVRAMVGVGLALW